MKLVRHDFSSFLEFLETAEKFSARYDGSEKFTGSASFGAADQIARIGDPRLEERARLFASRVQEALPEERIVKSAWSEYYDVAGEGVDLDLYLSGEVNCMRAYDVDAQRKSGQILRLALSINAFGSIEADTLLRRAAVLSCLVDVIESAGFRCEIIVFSSCRDIANIHETLLTVPVKQAEESLDLTRLLYAVGHPSMLRRHMFAAYHIPEVLNAIGPAFGKPTNAIAARELGDFDLFIGGERADYGPFADDASALEWILETAPKLTERPA